MELLDYIKPELFTLILVLIIIGGFLKETEKINDKWIPVILGVLGIIFATVYLLVFNELENIGQAIITGIVQGLLIAGAAVYSNQIYKQLIIKNKKE